MNSIIYLLYSVLRIGTRKVSTSKVDIFVIEFQDQDNKIWLFSVTDLWLIMEYYRIEYVELLLLESAMYVFLLLNIELSRIEDSSIQYWILYLFRIWLLICIRLSNNHSRCNLYIKNYVYRHRIFFQKLIYLINCQLKYTLKPSPRSLVLKR